MEAAAGEEALAEQVDAHRRDHPAQGGEALASARGRKTGLLMVVIADQRVRSAGQGRSLRVGSRTRLDDERGEACVAARVRVSARKQPRARQGPGLSHTRLPPSRIHSARAASDFPAPAPGWVADSALYGTT